MKVSSKEIRNVAVIGHSGEGKTTLCEAMLYNAGMIDRMGKTVDGTTVMDYDDIEKAKKISVYAAMSYLYWKGMKINIIDLPGFYDFEGERYEGLAAAGAAILVIGANGIVPVGAESVVDYCLKQGKPLVIFINGMDKENADYAGTIAALEEKYRGKLAPIQIPIMQGNEMKGFVNAIQEKAYKFSQQGRVDIEVPAELVEQMNEMQQKLMETAAENDDILLDKYFETGTLTKDEAVFGIRRGIAMGNTIPVMAGSALQNRGVINLLDEIVRYMPSANERSNIFATDLTADEIVNINCDEEGAFAAQVFKTVYDPYAGKLNYIKVFRGKINTGDVVYNSTTGKEERIGQILLVRGKKTEIVTELTAGDIGALSKLTATSTNDTLCALGTNIHIDDIRFPRPCISLAVTAVNKADEDKMYAGFQKITEEDLSFTTEKVAGTAEFVISGQGEVQLEVISKKLKARYNIDVQLSEPRIEYRETIRGTAEAEGKHKKQSGGHGQYGHCKVRFEPCEEEFVFAEEVVGGAVPKQYFPAVEKGLRECMVKGVLAGYPVTGVKATLFDGSYHDVDSSEMAFKLAAALAFKDGMTKAHPVILEPIYKVKVAIPSDYVGNVMGDLSKRRGRIMGSDTEDGLTVIVAEVPKSEITKYATDLRGITQGRGKFYAEYLRYEEVPPFATEKIIANANKD